MSRLFELVRDLFDAPSANLRSDWHVEFVSRKQALKRLLAEDIGRKERAGESNPLADRQ